MKRVFITLGAVAILVLSSCASKTGKVGKIDPNDVTYFQDPRTDICYAIIGAKSGDDFANQSTSIGLACVPCEQVEKYLVNSK
jgi:hypothetical protein